jgi:hypothetical protein
VKEEEEEEEVEVAEAASFWLLQGFEVVSGPAANTPLAYYSLLLLQHPLQLEGDWTRQQQQQ